MTTYIFHSILFQLVFLLMYELLLKKETFFQYNRSYLLLTPFLALLLPLMEFESLAIVGGEAMVYLPDVYIFNGAQEVAAEETFFYSTKEFWWTLYGIGVGVSFLLGFGKFRILQGFFHYPVASEEREYKIVSIPNSTLACTFFSTIFLGDQLKEEERKQILSHELVHVRLKHTWDLFLFEILRILFWFNPLVYIYQNKIAALHEFQADAEVVKQVEKRNYYQQLLNTAFNTENISFINQFFNHSLIKKRIVMLQKSKSKSIAKSKFFILLPLLLGMLVYVSCSDEDSSTIKEPVVIEVVEDPAPESIEAVPYSIIEEVPAFPGCEDQHGEARKACTSQKITEHVSSGFDVSLGKELGLTGINKIYVQFRISKEGEVEVLGVRGPDPRLEEEASRVVSNLPTLIPGKMKGETVPVLYSLPIIFNVGE